jgi:hypothetical protein
MCGAGRIFLLLWLWIMSVPVCAGNWSTEIYAGAAHSFSTKITIDQDEFPELKLSADYESKSFQTPIYYAWRVGRWSDRSAWEVELIHLKVFVTNTTAEVEHLGISHGYNLLLVNRAWKWQDWIFRAGGGVIIAHPETIVRGRFFEPGYDLTGPGAQVSLGRRFNFTKRWFGSLEGKFTLARARVTIAEGSALVPNFSIHGLFGLGVVF